MGWEVQKSRAARKRDWVKKEEFPQQAARYVVSELSSLFNLRRKAGGG